MRNSSVETCKAIVENKPMIWRLTILLYLLPNMLTACAAGHTHEGQHGWGQHGWGQLAETDAKHTLKDGSLSGLWSK